MINITQENRLIIIHVNGDIDHHTADELRSDIDDAYTRLNAKDIILDFGGVTFMDSSGIGMIIGRYKKVKKEGGTLSVTNVNNEVRRIFDLSGLHKIIKAHDNENALKDRGR